MFKQVKPDVIFPLSDGQSSQVFPIATNTIPTLHLTTELSITFF